ncbi:hypothetical protein MFLAVUS_004451 [Mucor flavus]|uniref:Uncharacterized protein n=1 Tax=Mucor flavus TaxID=439312 RepID=A0ABP9YW20_9FUNG
MSVDWDVDVIDYWQTSLSSYKKHHEQDIRVESDKVTLDILDNLPIKEGVHVVDKQIETEPAKVSEAAQVGNWSVVEEEEEEIEKEEKQEDEEEEEEEKECIGEEEPSVKKPRYNPSVPAAPPPPPPPVQQDNEALSNLMMAWYYAGYYTGVYQMDNENTNTTTPVLCTAGCGFFGNASFNNMCSRCYKTKSLSSSSPSAAVNSPISKDDTTIIPAIEKSRKHLRSPSPESSRTNSAPASSIGSPAHIATDEKPVQTNKGRCFKCRLKVPLAKQAANKCRCGYVFCDTHRYPDRHDCDIDYAKMDREILAKNNPKLHERPRGGRSFQRIDSL